MFAKFRLILALVALLVVSSCERIRDSHADCGVWLEFVFDHNMEYADAFDPQVERVDVYVFDRAGRFVLTRSAAIDDLEGRKRMLLGESLPLGEYKILTLGNLSEHFRVADLVPGTTTIEQFAAALRHNGAVSHAFAHLYFGHVVKVDYRADRRVWRVPLMRQTNRFNVVLQTTRMDVPDGTIEGPIAPAHTVEIIAPEAGAYDHLNNPLAGTTTRYRPWELLSRIDFTERGILQQTAAKIHTMRLLENQWNGYRIVVRDRASGTELWSHDLLGLLAATKPHARPDGTDLPRSEYFDRECDWNIVIVYQGGDRPGILPDAGGFVAVQIAINGWIVWWQGVEA